MPLPRLTAVPQKCVIEVPCITKSFDIFGEKSSCRARYEGVTKCRIYRARAVGKIAGCWEHGVCIVGLLEMWGILDFFKSVSFSRRDPWSE